MRFHAYLGRLIWKNDTRKNDRITIVAIFCPTAKKNGDQYTKRILPAFVTPECNIMLSNAMEYVAQCPQERINYAKAEILLGVGDPRTIRRHILRGRQIVEKTDLELTQVLSGLPGFARLPEQKPGVGRLESLAATVGEIENAATRMDGAGRVEVPAIGYVHVVYAFERARNPVKVRCIYLKTPLNRVLSNLAFDDTS